MRERRKGRNRGRVWLACAGCLVWVAGCGTRPCKPGTLLLTLTFADGAEAADAVDLTVSVGDGAPLTRTVAHQPARTSGTVEIDFTAGYPTGKTVQLTAIARSGGRSITNATGSVTAAPSCATLTLALGGHCTPMLTACPASAACGHVDDGCGGGPDCGPCQLVALEPSVARAGASVMLEGTFGSDTTVHFPGGVDVAATVAGAHRARVTVPAGATAGGLGVTSGGQNLEPLPFRRAPYALGLGQFVTRYEQADVARQMPSLVMPRFAPTAEVIGNYVYVIAGQSPVSSGARAPIASIERATINADGTLSAFGLLATPHLVTSRYAHTSAIVGHSLYVIAGLGSDGAALDSIERASINADGSLSDFTVVGKLRTARSSPHSAVIGNSLYVIGGFMTNSVERATIKPDGTLADFTDVPGVQMDMDRVGETVHVIGGSLYLIGGLNAASSHASVERATINPDGSISNFVPQPNIGFSLPRSDHVSVVLGDALYLIAGLSDSGSGQFTSLTSIEHATVGTDDSLSAFTPVAGLSEPLARNVFTSVVVGSSVYLIGGNGGLNGSPAATLERASIDVSGGLSPFSTASSALTVPRVGHASVVLGNWLYAIGGFSTGYLNSLERAPIFPDGSLGSFSVVNGVTLANARAAFSLAVIGGSLYALGGIEATTSVERALIGDDGSLSSFAPVGALASAHQGHTSAVIDNALYIIGGGVGSNIERSVINGDGSLSQFSSTQSALMMPRSAHSSLVWGNTLYVIGGSDGQNSLNSIESAAINTKGALLGFTRLTQTLSSVRAQHTSLSVGNSLYVIGGFSAGATLDRIERAALNPDGSLGAFGAMPGVALGTRRALTTATLTGSSLYVIGGMVDASSFLGSVEAAGRF